LDLSTTEKAVGQSWGAAEGEAELKDEEAGEAIAQTEQKEAETEDAQEAKGPVAEPEPEDNSISFAEYQAQQAEKKAALEAEFAKLQVRKANEGVKEDKKWANAKPLTKEEDDDFIAGSGGKAKREREKKVKQFVEIDNRYVEPERTRGGRGGRGGSRGDGGPRGRGDGPRGRGGEGPRGGRGRGGPRGDFPRGRENQPLNTNDQSAFPSLGS
jgi:plasminogen activator inhibitor 1 RNA-binding protein